MAVVPFTNISRSEADEWLGHGIAETVAADLESRDAFTVVALERVAAAMGGAAANRDDTLVAALGRELGSRWVVAGGYQRIGDRLRITARLVDTLNGTLAATARVDGAFSDIFDLQDRIAGELTRSAGARAPLGAAPGLPPGGGRARFGDGGGDAGAPPARVAAHRSVPPARATSVSSPRRAGGSRGRSVRARVSHRAGLARGRSAKARTASGPRAAAGAGRSGSAKGLPAPDPAPQAGARERPHRVRADSISSARSGTVGSAGLGGATRVSARPVPRMRATAR